MRIEVLFTQPAYPTHPINRGQIPIKLRAISLGRFMARLPRLTVAGYPHHIIQRGNDRQTIVRDDQDRQRLLDLWYEHARAFKVAIHAYVIMDNHFHLLATPETGDGLPKMMQAVGRAYVRYFNLRHRRSGTLWEGRYRSNLIESERYLLACMVYIDLNPVRAGMVQQAQDYLWSSHRHCIGRWATRRLRGKRRMPDWFRPVWRPSNGTI